MRSTRTKSIIIGMLAALYIAASAHYAASLAKRHIGPDDTTRAAVQISTDQAGVHEGRMFSISGIKGDLATDTFHWVSLTTPATGAIHLHAVDPWISTGNGMLLITEDPDVINTASGTVYTPVNRYRDSAYNSTAVVYNGINAVPTGEGYDIYSTDTYTFGVTGVSTDTFMIGDAIIVDGSTTNDRFYLIFDVEFSTPTAVITVNAAVTGATDGQIFNLGQMVEMTVFTSTGGTAEHLSSLDAEFILKPSTTYLLGLNNSATGDTATVAAWAIWSEEGE